MDEAYSILPKEAHVHWDKFKNLHSEKIVNFVRSILGDDYDKEKFERIYFNLSRIKKPALRRRQSKKCFEFLVKYGWIKDKMA